MQIKRLINNNKNIKILKDYKNFKIYELILNNKSNNLFKIKIEKEMILNEIKLITFSFYELNISFF